MKCHLDGHPGDVAISDAGKVCSPAFFSMTLFSCGQTSYGLCLAVDVTEGKEKSIQGRGSAAK